MNGGGFNRSLDHIDDENQIPTSSGSTSSYENNQYSSDDERPHGRKSYNVKRSAGFTYENGLVKYNNIDDQDQIYPSNSSSLFIEESGMNDYMTKRHHRNNSNGSTGSNHYQSKVTGRNKVLQWDDMPNQSYPRGSEFEPPLGNPVEDDLTSSSDMDMLRNINLGPRNNRNPVLVMCGKLLETRNLLEAIEFVEQNRQMIEFLTSIIREAPAYRNYDLSSYHIDYSIKESFNSDFWLDREPIQTTADGNCQYHAVSLSLTGSEMYTPQVRLATAVAVIDNREWFASMLQLIDRGSVLDLVHTISRNYSWGDETTLKAIAVAIHRRIFIYTCNLGKKDYELVKSLSRDELLDAFREKKYRGGTGIHIYADPLTNVNPNNYIMLFHKSEHFIAVLPKNQQPTLYEPFNPILPALT